VSNSSVKPIDVDLTPARTWSLANASIPLTLAVAWVGQLVFLGYLIGGLSTEVHTLTRNAEKSDSQVYQQKDATRDFARMQDHVDAAVRRIELLEQDSLGKRR
jgi:hypothetical protein